MLKPQLIHQSQPVQTFFNFPKPFVHGGTRSLASLPASSLRQSKLCPKKERKGARVGSASIKSVLSDAEKSVSVKAILSVSPTVGGFLSNLGITKGLDDIQDLLGKSLLLELVSAELDPSKYN